MGGPTYIWHGPQKLWVPSSQGGGTQGVTDGSDPAPGMVGECVEAYLDVQAYVMQRRNESAWDQVPLDTVLTMNLSAGDWAVCGDLSMENDYSTQPNPGPTTYIAAQLTPLPNQGFGAWAFARGVTSQDWGVAFAPFRVNTAMPVVVAMLLEVCASIAGTNLGRIAVWPWIRAWRVR